jgi:hypothetical protein
LYKPVEAVFVGLRQRIAQVGQPSVRIMLPSQQKTQIKKDMKTLYEAPQVQTVELRLENAVLQASLNATMPNYGDWITNEWENEL